MATVTGTTTNDYAYGLEWLGHAFDKNTIIIKNTDAANALKLKVYALASADGLLVPLELSAGVTERTLVAGDTQKVNIYYHYYAIYVAVKSSVAESHATYQIDYTGGLQR